MTSSRYAHLRIGDCDIAVPAIAVERAVALPAAGLTALPRREGALCGLIDVAGSAVPVVAFDRWVPLGQHGDRSEARIVVLQDGALRVAVCVDALVGTVQVDLSAVRTVCHTPDHEELFEAIVPATADRPLLCILEVARLMALATAWCAQADVTPAAHAGVARTCSTAAAGMALFTIGEQRWAVPAGAIARLAKAPPAELRWPGQRVAGIGSWETRKLPLVDLAPSNAAVGSERPWMAVLVDGALAIGLVASRCDRMLAVPAGDIIAASGDELRAGTTWVDGIGAVAILDVDGLFRTISEATISRVPAPKTTTTTRTDRADDAQTAALGDDTTHYLVFEADRRYASPVAGVLGVAALPPATIDDLAAGGRAMLTWRGQTVAVVAMPSLDGGHAASDLRVAVILEGSHAGQAHSAVAVRGLRDWLSAKSARRSGMQRRDIGELSMITPPGGQRSGSLVVVDLAQMAQLLA